MSKLIVINVLRRHNKKPAHKNQQIIQILPLHYPFLTVIDLFLLVCHFQANPSKLHSNLKFIKLFRRQEKLISEAEYYFTNLVSATSFIVDLNAKSLSMDENKFEESMQAAKLMNKVTNESSSTCQMSQQQNNECSFSEKMPHKPNATGG